MSLKNEVNKVLEHAADKLACDLHNDGGSLTGNTAASDVLWTARRLYDRSVIGASDVATRDWRITPEEFAELNLTPKPLWNVVSFEDLPQPQKEACIKLPRMVLLALPDKAERIGERWMLQARAVRAVWNEIREDKAANRR